MSRSVFSDWLVVALSVGPTVVTSVHVESHLSLYCSGADSREKW